MRIAIGCDHKGLAVKKFVMKLLDAWGHSYRDFGCETAEPVDYPDIARVVGQAVAGGDFERGILICDTGIGMCIAANKINGIRAALCQDAFCAARSRQHNDANVLCLAGMRGQEQVTETVKAFLTTEFEGGRHQRRVDKIKALEG